jgi:hypothetical protein
MAQASSQTASRHRLWRGLYVKIRHTWCHAVLPAQELCVVPQGNPQSFLIARGSSLHGMLMNTVQSHVELGC